MAYEPVFASTGVTTDPNLTPGEESGFRHYLKTISTVGLSNTYPTENTTNTLDNSPIYITPQDEAVNDRVWEPSEQTGSSSTDTTSLTELSTSMTVTAASTTTGQTNLTSNTESGFQEGGLSSSNFSSPMESPRFTPTEQAEEEVDDTNKHLTKLPFYQSKSQLNSQPRGGQTISSWFQRIFRKKDSKATESPG